MGTEAKIEYTLFVAVKAFIVHNGKVLLLHESKTNPDGTQQGKYGIPGGRIHPGEHFIDGLKREVFEESGLTELFIIKPLFVDEWRPIVRGEHWHIVGTFFECTTSSDVITLSNEHDAYIWIDPADYPKYHLIENEIAVFENYLQNKQ